MGEPVTLAYHVENMQLRNAQLSVNRLRSLRVLSAVLLQRIASTKSELLSLATGDRTVTLVHCVEDRLCVWRPDRLMELSYQVVLIEGHPTWSGRAKHSYGHFFFLELENGVHAVQTLQITNPQIIPHGVLSWVSFDLPAYLKTMLSTLLSAAGVGNTDLFFFPVRPMLPEARS